MKGYSAFEVFKQYELLLYERARLLVEEFPERDQEGRHLRCHEVARAVGALLELEVVDGKYEVGAEHSWLVVTRLVGHFRWWCILDPYVVGRMPPVQLIAVVPMMPLRYTPGAMRTDIRNDVVKYLKEMF